MLRAGLAELNEAEEVGAGTLAELHKQRETMASIDDKVQP